MVQEVEFIIPEVARTNEVNRLKSIKYQILVGSLPDAIKDQQTQNYNFNLILKNSK